MFGALILTNVIGKAINFENNFRKILILKFWGFEI
jgi:hypothetical protein